MPGALGLSAHQAADRLADSLDYWSVILHEGALSGIATNVRKLVALAQAEERATWEAVIDQHYRVALAANINTDRFALSVLSDIRAAMGVR